MVFSGAYSILGRIFPQLVYIMNHTVELPLGRNLPSPLRLNLFSPFITAYISEDWLDPVHSSAIALFSLFAVYDLSHFIQMRHFPFTFYSH